MVRRSRKKYLKIGPDLEICNCIVKEPKIKTEYVILLVLIVLTCVALGVAHLMGAFSKSVGKALYPPNPTKPLKASRSHLHTFTKAAVCADGIPCAKIGKEILEKNGSAVDAAIATLFCNGIVNMQSMGLGGGFFMTVYIKEEKRAYTLNAREFAPLNATNEMYKGDPKKSKKGPLAVGVPGELKGYWEAYKRFGKLPWKDLVQPAIELCKSGYNITLAQHDSLKLDEDNVKKDQHLKTWFTDDEKIKGIGSLIRPEKLCETLKIIAEKGGDELYNGSLSKILVEDIQQMGGIITEEDMKNYTADWLEPITTEFLNGDQFYSMPLPGGGLLLAFILNILDGYHFDSQAITDTDSTVQTYQRTIEAFKYAYARRAELGDMDFVPHIQNLIQNLTSREYAEDIRTNINDNVTSNDHKTYGGVYVSKDDHGTAHISILAQNGDAVSATSTINLYFGAGITSKRTGIVLNSCMDDFSFPDFPNYFGVPYSPSNKMEPRKRSLSSMSPTIITDKNGDVKLVIGASGGTKITTAVAQVIMRILWFGQNVKDAVDAPRFHHQLFPMEVQYEFGTIQPILDGLEKRGHNTSRYTDRGSIVCVMYKNGGKIYANSDFRKGGDVFGID